MIRNRPILFCCALFAPLLLLPALGWAQAVQASITGVVRDSSGAVLPGVAVEASSDALIEKVRTTVSDGQGLYRITDLRPGIYVVTFALSGFNTVRREDITLTPGFVATVNADLRVGALEETVTVSGQSPIVDVQSTVQQRVMSRDVLDSLPTGKTIQAYASLTPGVVIPPTAQDVGGSQGELFIAMGIHGNRSADMKLLQDGLRFNSMEGTAGGAGRGFYVNAASAQEVSLETGSTSAETETGGIMLNIIPKEGGNRFSGYLFTNYTGNALQSGNMTDELRERGLTLVNSVEKVWDLNGAVGGPIRKDKLWFFSAHRSWGNEIRIAGNWVNATPQSWFYTPDLERQAIRDDSNRSHNLRLTWQATQKNKINLSYDIQDHCVCHVSLTSLFSPEATVRWRFHPNYFITAAWNYPMTNKVLFEAAAGVLNFDWPNFRQEGVTVDTISVQEQSTGYRYRAAASSYGNKYTPQANQRFSMSYVTGSHHFKTGLFLQEGYRRHVNEVNGDVNYRFRNGVPNLITLYAAPLIYVDRLKANVGLFAQDQWTIDRVTLNLGLRFDYLNAFVPVQHLGAGRFVGERNFGKVECVPCWKDLDPRVGVSYDLFGSGKTALKASLGRYVIGAGVDQARLNNPVVTTVQTATRTWEDRNGNFIPEGDFGNPGTNEEIGPLSDLGFGQTRVLTRYADDIMRGYGNRGSNWQSSVGVQHELIEGVGLSVGWFRTWYGNIRTTDNLAVSAADFNAYSVRAPADARLPNGGGYVVTGLYDVTRATFGAVNNLVTQSSNYGEQTEVYNGFDATVNIRPGRRGVQLSGGLSTGRTVTDWCFNLGNPQLQPVGQSSNDPRTEQFCHQTSPWSANTQLKFAFVYEFPGALQASGTFQSLPGIPVQALYTATNAEIAPSLGRNLSACPAATGACNATASFNLIEPNTMFEDRLNQLDVRLTRVFRVARYRLQGMIDLYNVLNASTVLSVNTTYGPAWLRPIQILDGRLFKFGAQFDF
jgi:hypothetical protein